MKKNIFLVLIGISILACNNNTPTTQNTSAAEVVNTQEQEVLSTNTTSPLDGVYYATLPGASKGSIQVEISIKGDLYIRNEKQGDDVFSDQGNVLIHKDVIILKTSGSGEESYFKATPKGLVMLNSDKQENQGELSDAYHFTKK